MHTNHEVVVQRLAILLTCISSSSEQWLLLAGTLHSLLFCVRHADR